jgi:hypothetical protein
MKFGYQIKVWQELEIKDGKLVANEEIVLKPHLTTEEIQYWQRRIWELLPGHYASAMVAK